MAEQYQLEQSSAPTPGSTRRSAKKDMYLRIMSVAGLAAASPYPITNTTAVNMLATVPAPSHCDTPGASLCKGQDFIGLCNIDNMMIWQHVAAGKCLGRASLAKIPADQLILSSRRHCVFLREPWSLHTGLSKWQCAKCIATGSLAFWHCAIYFYVASSYFEFRSTASAIGIERRHVHDL